jgi:hypothetical protein
VSAPTYTSVVVTTAADGSAAVNTVALRGRLVSIHYVKDDFADGVDFDLVSDQTGQVLWDEDDVNASKTVAPRQPIHTTGGVAAVYAGAGEPVLDYIRLCEESVLITIADGGNATSGTFVFVTE